MAYRIVEDKCKACGECANECPMGAISKDDDKNVFVIDADNCVSCGSCANTCEHGAIVEED